MKKALRTFFDTLNQKSLTLKSLLLFILGGASALCFAPFNWVWVLVITLPILISLVYAAKTVKQSFWLSWFFFLGYFVIGLYWISWALFTDIEQFWWAVPLAVLGLPVLLSIFQAAFIALARKINPDNASSQILLFSVCWFLGELTRGVMFTGFPWNLLGYAWSADEYLIILQSVSLWGIYGLSLVTILVLNMPYIWLFETDRKLASGHQAFALIVVGFTLIVGKTILHRDLVPSDFKVRLVQPNIPQVEKWDPAYTKRNFKRLVEMSKYIREGDIDAIIWPETAVALMSTQDKRYFEGIADDILAQKDQSLIVGVLEPDLVEEREVLRNSIVVFGSDGARTDTYSKSHLVPFGEYLPFQKYWPVDPIAGGGPQFEPGEGQTKIVLKGTEKSFSPLVCYEVIFPKDVVDKDNKPDFLLNVTNDAWYGLTAGPYQHLAIARVRAIEERMPLVRVANTGISAVIDPVGRIVDAIPLGEQGFANVSLSFFPQEEEDDDTPKLRYERNDL